MANLDVAEGYSPGRVRVIRTGSERRHSSGLEMFKTFCGQFVSSGSNYTPSLVTEYSPDMVAKLFALRAAPDDPQAPAGEEEFLAWLNGQ